MSLYSMQSLFGYRIYRGQKNEGWYLQPAASLGYMSLDVKGGGEHAKASGLVGSALTYLGYSSHGDVGVYIDFGLGYQFANVTATDENGDEFKYQGSGPTLDMNLGIGLPF